MFAQKTVGKWVAGVLLGGLFSLAAHAAASDIIYKGDAKCTRCHDESETVPVLSIAKTKHGTVADGRVPSCVSCHGESEKHANKPEDVKVRPSTDRNFTKHSKLTAAQKDQACTTCHQGGKHMGWSMGAHARNDISCNSCHQVHTGKDKVRDKRTQAEVCYTCHKQQRAESNKPSHHPVPEGLMTCSSCHAVHDSSAKLLTRGSVNDTCYTCHMEKRGPFLHNHQPVTENCSICHNPHGTTTASLLKARSPFLCQECHSHTSHPGQRAVLSSGISTAVATTNSTSTLGVNARGCMNCHTNIHGGNSLVNSATAGRFRR